MRITPNLKAAIRRNKKRIYKKQQHEITENSCFTIGSSTELLSYTRNGLNIDSEITEGILNYNELHDSVTNLYSDVINNNNNNNIAAMILTNNDISASGIANSDINYHNIILKNDNITVFPFANSDISTIFDNDDDNIISNQIYDWYIGNNISNIDSFNLFIKYFKHNS